MWIDSKQRIVADRDQYAGEDGTLYPANFPKSEVPGLTPLTVVQPALGPFERYGQPQIVNGKYVYPVEPMSTVEIMAQLTEAVQRHLDAKARERNYDGILSACSYATSTHTPFAAEAQACVNWRDAVWGACYQIMGEVQAGIRQTPTESELLALLPDLAWP